MRRQERRQARGNASGLLRPQHGNIVRRKIGQMQADDIVRFQAGPDQKMGNLVGEDIHFPEGDRSPQVNQSGLVRIPGDHFRE